MTQLNGPSRKNKIRTWTVVGGAVAGLALVLHVQQLQSPVVAATSAEQTSGLPTPVLASHQTGNGVAMRAFHAGNIMWRLTVVLLAMHRPRIATLSSPATRLEY